MSSSRSILRALACTVLIWSSSIQTSSAQSDISQPDILLDTADVTSGWRGQNTISLDSTIKVHGSASLKSVGARKDRFRKVFSTPVDVSQMRYLTFWYYVDRPDLLGAPGGTEGQVEISSSGTFDSLKQNWSVASLHLQRGWNYVVLDLPGTARGGTMDVARVNHFRIYHDPQASITTRIDHITFTNTSPPSFPYAKFLEQKRLSRSTAAVEEQDDLFAFVQRTRAGSAARNRLCRRLRLDLTHQEISGFTLKGMGVSAATVDNDIHERRLIKEFICGERTFSRTELLTRIQQRAVRDVAVTGQLASLFDLPMAAAAETRESVLELDLTRIMTACGSDPVEVERYVRNGTQPSLLMGMNVLVRDCVGTPSDIAIYMGDIAPPVNDRKATYKACMAAFTEQAAECSNPYANDDDTFKQRIDTNPNLTDQQKEDTKRSMEELMRSVESFSVNDARELVGATYADASHDEFETLEDLHEQYDQTRGKIAVLGISDAMREGLDQPFEPGAETPEEQAGRIATVSAERERIQAEKRQLEAERQDLAAQICFKDPNDPICQEPQTPGPEPQPPEDEGPNPGMGRCADMQFDDGQKMWFDKPAGASGLGSQINEGDRIDHCLCELFSRDYNNSLPGNIVVGWPAGCPTPEERIAQKCLENPYDEVDGVRPECKHLMQPISMDRDVMGARMCEKILPDCDRTYLEPDDSCGCATPRSGGGFNLPGCNNIPNCPEGSIPSATICGACQTDNSGANLCTPGGKDFYLARDSVNDLKVRIFPREPNFPTDNILLARAGGVRFATPGFKRSELFNDRQLWIRTVLPGASYDGTGQIKVSCTNLTTGVRNRLVETIPLSELSSEMPTFVPIELSSTERAACFGSNPDSKVHLEFFVDTKPNQPVGFFDILDDIGNIKPPCLEFPPRPTPGGRPLNDWPQTWTFSDGITIEPFFNGVGTIPIQENPPPLTPPSPTFPVCVVDGIVRPCP